MIIKHPHLCFERKANRVAYDFAGDVKLEVFAEGIVQCANYGLNGIYQSAVDIE